MGRWSQALPVFVALALSQPSAGFVPAGCGTTKRSPFCFTRNHMQSFTDSLSDDKAEEARPEAVAQDAEAPVAESAKRMSEKEETKPVVAEPTLEEQISASASSAATALGSSHSYEAVLQSMEDSKDRTKRRLDRTAYEKERADDRIARLKAKMEKETRKVELELQEKIAKTQASIDEEMERMFEVLQSEIALESQREAQILDSIKSLKESIAAEEADAAGDDKITTEMTEVRSKLKPGAIASQLDDLLKQKRTVVTIEGELVSDLKACVAELQAVLEDERSRAAVMKEAVDRLARPEAKASAPHDWTDFDEMEAILEKATEQAAASESRVQQLRGQINEGLINKANILGEAIPPSLQGAANMNAAKMAASEVNLILSSSKSDSVVKYNELKDKDESELVSTLANSVGKTVVDGSKAAVFGLKALLDTVTGQAVSEATSEVIEKSSGITKGISDISGAIKDIDSPNDLTKNEVLKDSVKSTGEVLGAVGKTGQAIASNVGKTKSAQQAAVALEETSQDLASTVNAAAALGMKLFQKAKKRASEEAEKMKQDEE